MRKIALSLLMIACMLPGLSLAANSKLVLVTSDQSSLVHLSVKDLKKLYLGLDVEKKGVEVTAIRNYSDELLHEVFLQHVIFMSSRNYEKQLMTRTLRSGKKPIQQFSNRDEIVKNLLENPNSVSYLWEEDVSANPNLKILQYLWSGSRN